MPEVIKIGITEKNNQKIQEVKTVKVIANQGIVGDRHFKEFNDPFNQLSLIESENIDYYNIKYGLNIPYIDFRRNIITKGIKLNDLVGKKIKIGSVEVDLTKDKSYYFECLKLLKLELQKKTIKKFKKLKQLK